MKKPKSRAVPQSAHQHEIWNDMTTACCLEHFAIGLRDESGD